MSAGGGKEERTSWSEDRTTVFNHVTTEDPIDDHGGANTETDLPKDLEKDT